MNFYLGVFTLVFSLKALGGSFNEVFYALDLPNLFGPLTGTVMIALMVGFLLTYSEPVATKNEDRIPTWFIFAFVSLMVIAVVIRAQDLVKMPIDVFRADMLLTIQSQIRDFFAGNNPYAPTELPDGRTVFRFYLPTLWLSYAPLYWLGIDVRWLNIVAQLVFYTVLLDCFIRKRGYPKWGRSASCLIFLALVALHVFSKEARREVTDTQTGPFWLFYSLFLWSVAREYVRPKYLLIPLVATCRHVSLFLLIPYFVYLFKSDRIECTRTARMTVVVSLVVLMPVLFYWENLFEALHAYGSTIFEHNLYYWIGLAGVLKYFQLLPLQKLFQLSGLFVGCYLVLFKRPGRFQSLAMGGLAYLSVIAFVGTTFPYLYAEIILLIYFLLHCPPSEKQWMPVVR